MLYNLTVDIKDWASLGGLVLGAAGFTTSLLAFFRDRARIRVTLTFNMEPLEPTPADADSLWSVVSVSNIGRRPMFVSHIGLSTASWRRWRTTRTTLVVWDGLQGRKLEEGAGPWVVPCRQGKALAEYGPGAKRLRAFVTDSAGRCYWSRAVVRPPAEKYREPENDQEGLSIARRRRPL